MKKILSALLTFVLIFSLVGCSSNNTENKENNGQTNTETKVKVALLLPGNINDAGWNAAAYNGLMEAKDKYKLEVAYTESIPLAEQESTIRDYASKGFNLIICHGNDFADAVTTLAPEFPKTYFAVSNSPIRLENAIGMDVMNEEQGYIAGYTLGLITKANKVGFVGSTEMLPMKRTEVGFKQGVKDANPSVEAIVAYTGSGDDTAKGKETALAIFDKGVDCVFQYAQGSGIGVIQGAKEKNKPVVVTTSNQVKLAPEVAVLSVTSDMKVNILAVIDAYVNNKFNSDLKIVGSLSSGLYKIGDINKNLVTDEQAQKILDQVEKIKEGKIVLGSEKK